MELEDDKRVHKILSNVFYYSFVCIIVALFILSLVIEEITLLNNILFIALIISSLVIVFYLIVQILRYNLTVNKKVQLGVFLIVIGFLLILLSTSKDISFLRNLNLGYFEYNYFVYWGIGSIILGIMVELTFIDQLIWKIVIQPFKFLWKITVRFAKWVGRNWLDILLYTLDLVSLAGIIYVLILWEIIWWKLVILSLSCVYPIIHHYKLIWRALKYVVVDIIYLSLTKVYTFFKNLITSIWSAIVRFFEFLLRNWWPIFKEIMRFAGAAGGGVMIYYGLNLPEYSFLITVGIVTIIVSLIFTRLVVLKQIWILISTIASSILDRIVSFAKFLQKYWWSILKEILRLVGAAGGVYLIYHGAVFEQFNYFIAIGIFVIIISLIFSRKTVLIATWNAISGFFKFIWEEIIKPYYKRIINETIRLIFVGTGIFLIYYGVVNSDFYYLVYTGIAGIILVEIFIRKWFLIRLYNFLKGIVLAFWDFIKWLGKPLRFLWKVLVKTVKFLVKNWFKVILYLLDFVALGAIIYLSVTWLLQWWYVVLLAVSCGYIPAHHYKIVWKVIKFIGIEIFYNPFLRFVNLIVDFFKAIWNWFVELIKFIKKNWWTITKEFLRLVGVAGGIVLIVYGVELEELQYLVWIGITVIIISAVFSRKIVFVKIYHAVKAIFKFFFDYRVILSRILGFIAVVVGLLLYFAVEIISFIPFIIIVSIGGMFVLFAHFIYHPKKLWEFLVSIPKTIYKILVTIWLSIKSVSIYIYQNGIRLVLLIVMIFTLVYGFLVAFNVDFFHIFENVETAIRISLGAAFVVVAVVAFILLRRELQKLRTGSTKKLIQQIRERWTK